MRTATDRIRSPWMYRRGRVHTRAINMSMPACAAIAERDSRCGANTEEWIAATVALKEELHIQFPQAHAYWTIGEDFLPDGTRSDGELGEELMRRSVLAAEALGWNGWSYTPIP